MSIGIENKDLLPSTETSELRTAQSMLKLSSYPKNIKLEWPLELETGKGERVHLAGHADSCQGIRVPASVKCARGSAYVCVEMLILGFISLSAMQTCVMFMCGHVMLSLIFLSMIENCDHFHWSLHIGLRALS